MENYIAESAVPSPKSTVNAYRSFGYNLSTAVADIIDNSISAGADRIFLDFEWKGKDSYLSVLDNGVGMNRDELVLAMTPGSKDPEESRAANDLGRFGMGLKTASFSQCRKLTVISKKTGFNTIKRCWDLDFINSINSWILLDFVSDENFIKKFDAQKSGTMVLWENLDRLVGESHSENETVQRAFFREMMQVKDHLALVFHRFIEKKTVKLFYNGDEIEPLNPFLLNCSVKPEMGATEYFDNAEVTYFILPHMSEIPREEYDKTGGSLGWFESQGFYIYRGDRLLVAGDWLGLERKRDYSKLARIAVNFGNTGDFNWNLDIKKSTATPPLAIRNELSRIAKIAVQKSAKIYNWRGQKTMSSEMPGKVESLWNDEISRDGIKKYKINRSHPVVSLLLAKDDGLFKSFLKMVEDNVPVELILSNQNEDPAYHELEKQTVIPPDSLINLAKELYDIQISQGVPESLVKQQIMNSMPFNQFPIINDYLK